MSEPTTAAPDCLVEVYRDGAFVCPVDGCGKRFAPLALLITHMREPIFGGHNRKVTLLSVRLAHEPQPERKSRGLRRRNDK